VSAGFLLLVAVLALGVVSFLDLRSSSPRLSAALGPSSFDADSPLIGQPPKTVSPSDSPTKRLSFVAVGDNLIHASIYNSHAIEGGGYDFNDMYDPVREVVSSVDLAYLNQETICGGSERGLADYPCFNSPHEVLDAVAAAGFDWVNTASNHSFDVGEAGILSQLAHLETLPSLRETGTHDSWESAQRATVFEVNGVSIGLASYTYGLNGFVLPQGKEYLVDLIDVERMRRDIEQLTQFSDLQIVSMHWGDENSHEQNDEQISLAHLLSDLGVDVVVGAHPHVVQPTTMITSESGQQTLVIYSLGNFISAQDEPERMLGEMAAWTISFNPSDGAITFEDIEIRPTVTQILPSWHGYKVYLLRDYTEELAQQHMLAPKGLTRDYLINLATQVFGTEFPLVF
jgi:poly-gamma-glutamate synthesis protein (capsule biosynthesis protein)